MFELREVSKSFGPLQALRPTTLATPKGQTTALLGPSGCGKSTLLRMMVGLVTPDTGEVLLDGQPLTRASLPQARRRLGYMIQDGGLFPHMTIRDNASLMARHLRWPRDKVAARLEQLVELTRLPGTALQRFPHQISGGQRQRAALMRALFLDPDVVLLDEPMGALDPLVRSELQAELRGIFRALGKTVVLVTHDIGEAGFLADTLVLLRGGGIVQSGGLRDLVERPTDSFVTTFINAQRGPFDALGGPPA